MVWSDFPRMDCRQNDNIVRRHVMLKTMKAMNIMQVDSFQKNGKISVEVVSANVAHSKAPYDNFLHRELNPNDGYRCTVMFPDFI